MPEPTPAAVNTILEDAVARWRTARPVILELERGHALFVAAAAGLAIRHPKLPEEQLVLLSRLYPVLLTVGADLQRYGVGQLEMSQVDAYWLLSALQLAYGHPDTSDTSALAMEVIGRNLMAQICDTPELLNLLARGWERHPDAVRDGRAPVEEAL